MADTMGLLVSEQPLYGWISFIAEFGGALSLFLGVSFMMIWDAGRVVWKRLVIRAKNNCDESVEIN